MTNHQAELVLIVVITGLLVALWVETCHLHNEGKTSPVVLVAYYLLIASALASMVFLNWSKI